MAYCIGSTGVAVVQEYFTSVPLDRLCEGASSLDQLLNCLSASSLNAARVWMKNFFEVLL